MAFYLFLPVKWSEKFWFKSVLIENGCPVFLTASTFLYKCPLPTERKARDREIISWRLGVGGCGPSQWKLEVRFHNSNFPQCTAGRGVINRLHVSSLICFKQVKMTAVELTHQQGRGVGMYTILQRCVRVTKCEKILYSKFHSVCVSWNYPFLLTTNHLHTHLKAFSPAAPVFLFHFQHT